MTRTNGKKIVDSAKGTTAGGTTAGGTAAEERTAGEKTAGGVGAGGVGAGAGATEAAPGAGVGWGRFAAVEPELAKTSEERFGAFTHHVLATLRKDGSPRTTGLEVRFLGGELWLGMMPGSVKALDLLRDGRFALQANPGEGQSMGGGDIRIAGRAVEVTDPARKAAYSEEVEPPEPFHLFRTEVTEVVRTFVEDEKYLVVQVWRPGAPVRTLKRT